MSIPLRQFLSVWPTRGIRAKDWSLDEDEVHSRVGAYEDPHVTDELLEFGKILIAANRERTAQLESKAVTVTGYSIAVLAFLVSREPIASVIAQWPPRLIAAASWCAGLSLACAGVALLVRAHAWLSDSHWVENENGTLDDPDHLKRDVLAMRAVNRQMKQSNGWKANAVVAAQVLLLGAGGFMAAWILSR